MAQIQYSHNLVTTRPRDKSQFVPIWTFLIATEFARLVLQDHGAGPVSAVDDLRQFMQQNFPDESFGMAQTLTFLKERQAKVECVPKWVSISGKSNNTKFSEVHYQQCTDALLKRLKNTQTESTYYLLVDNLDEGYQAGDMNLRLVLLALLRAIEDISIQLLSHQSHYRPVLVLRSDIFDRLADSDLNKLDDYVVRLHWRSAVKSRNSLLKIVEARIRASGLGEGKWKTIAFERDPTGPRGVSSLWKYLTNRTFERPRDIIKFLKLCRQYVDEGKLAYENVVPAERNYSGWLYREMRDELHSHLPVWRESLQCIAKLGKGRFDADELRSQLENDSVINRWIENNNGTTDEIIELLFDFSILGNLSKSGLWLFSYKDQDLPWSPDRPLIVHFGFHNKLRLKKYGQ